MSQLGVAAGCRSWYGSPTTGGVCVAVWHGPPAHWVPLTERALMMTLLGPSGAGKVPLMCAQGCCASGCNTT